MHEVSLPQARVTARHQHHLMWPNAQLASTRAQAAFQGVQQLIAAAHIGGSR